MNCLASNMFGSSASRKLDQFEAALAPLREFKTDFEHSLLLQRFYEGMRTDKAKIFFPAENIDKAISLMSKLGIEPKQGEIISYRGPVDEDRKLQWVYTLYDIDKRMFQKLYLHHVFGDLNLCLFHNLKENQNACINLDVNKSLYDSTLKIDRDSLLDSLKEFLEPMRGIAIKDCSLPCIIVPSGSGYHVWFRFSQPIANSKLRQFTQKLYLASLKWKIVSTASDANKIYSPCSLLGIPDYSIRCYPLDSIFNTAYDNVHIEGNSIRLFGSTHCNTEQFTNIVGHDGKLMNNADTWKYLKFYLDELSISENQLDLGMEELNKWESILQ